MSIFRIASEEADVVEHADWVEINALYRENGIVSQEDLSRALHQASSVSDDDAHQIAESTFSELSDRAQSCPEANSPIAIYPFELTDNNFLLRRKPKNRRPYFGLLYLFLLGITRTSMESGLRSLAGLDPTILFERLCADVLINFWGGKSTHSDAMIFGTGRLVGASKFSDRIDGLCNALGEGAGWKMGAKMPKSWDGKLDVAVWRKFQDVRSGGLVGFAQCKTGIHWEEHITELQPRAFCGDYMQKPLLLDPVQIYMVPSRIGYPRWDGFTRKGGLVFDRCRITQYGSLLSKEIVDQCNTWLNALLAKGRAQ